MLHLVSEFTLESGRTLRQVPVAFQTWGRLNTRGDNAVVVCHALTGNTQADQWWGGLVGPGRALDTDRYFVVCANVIGSPYGTLSPLTRNPDTGQPWGADFPRTTIRDTVALHRALLEALGVQQVALAVGGSMGGMQVLEWAFQGDFVQRIAPIAVGGRHSAWCIGWSEAQRQAVFADPRWQDGRYDPEYPPTAGLAAARMMAMISYRARPEFEHRFGRQAQEDDGLFRVEGYLRHQGAKLVQRFDANCYVHLTWQMDTHDVARGRGSYPDVLRGLWQPALVVGIRSDVLYPLEEQEELVKWMPNAELFVLDAPYGHDTFLIELDPLNGMLHRWMAATEQPARLVG